DVPANVGINDTVTGSVTSTDPTTGVKTTTTADVAITGSDHVHDHEDETDTHTDNASGSPVRNDIASQTNSDIVSTTWNGSQTVARMNPDGTLIGTPNTTSGSGTDAVNSSVVLSKAVAGTVTATPLATDSGSSTSS